jgi:hypothetical protein
MTRVISVVLIFTILVYAFWLDHFHYDFFLQSVQEDEYLEWSTFWGFILASVLFGLAARHQFKAEKLIPWFLAGVGAFCFIFAMEEISWGQRVLGFRPSAYFLDNNYQQELNYHNVVEKGNRKLLLKLIILSYGFFLPIICMEPLFSKWTRRLAFVPPPALFILPFVAIAFFYHEYPLEYSGEIAELMLALGFIYSATDYLQQAKNTVLSEPPSTKISRTFWRLSVPLILWVCVISIGVVGGYVSRTTRSVDPEMARMAQIETDALKADMIEMYKSANKKNVTVCGLHMRLNSYVSRYRVNHLRVSNYNGLTATGLPEERAQFFIDPWNSPYWLRHYCSEDKQVVSVFVYSFGPNRKRDSSRTDLDGDDIGSFIARRK